MASINFDEITAFAERLADAARGQTLPLFRTGATIYNKAGALFDPVTDADRAAERVIREMIEAVRPDDGIVGEEFGVARPEAPSRWVIDPIDGTKAFLTGSPTWTTLIAYEDGATPVFGLIDQPFTDERWIGATAPAGAAEEATASGEGVLYRRGETALRARASDCEELAKARLSTTDPRRSIYFTPDEHDAFEEVAGATRVARFSFDAYAYGLLALGELDLVIEAGLKHHDFAAIVPVVRAAGGVVTNWRGAVPGADDRGRILAAATPALHEQALTVLSKCP
ncbi:MAG: inositol monophosphatase family protein [Pseudomonadota bacterium]